MKRRNFVKSVIGGAFLTIVPTTLFGFSKKRSKLKIDKEGNKRWYLNGKLHREDGPAIECVNGTKKWYLNGKEVKKEDVIINAFLTEREYINFIIKRLL